MTSIYRRFVNLRGLLVAPLFVIGFSSVLFAQGPCGGKPCPRIVIPGTRAITHKPKPPHRPPRHRPDQETPQPEPEPEPVCEDSDLVVVCNMPGCEITLNGANRQVTNDFGGFTFQVPGNQGYTVKVTKPGYEPFQAKKKLDCHDSAEVPAVLTAKPVTLRVRTIPAECEIYLDGQKQPKGSDAQGLFSYLLTKPSVLIKAGKARYLSKTRSLVLAPELANGEIVLELEPLGATVKLTVNVEGAGVTIDNESPPKPIGERLVLPPGSHVLTVEALGYAPAKLDLSLGPDETVTREIQLERLPVTELESQASNLLSRRTYDQVLKLCGYILEVDPGNGVAHRLQGFVYLERGDLANATAQFDQALNANEPVTFRVRRHLGEKFDLAKGHDTCDAHLTLRKSEIEFQGLRNPAENFKAAYDQVQVVGIQLKSSRAVYLGTKVNIAGKKHDYNFYSFDNELSQTGKAYLEMIQRLLRPH